MDLSEVNTSNNYRHPWELSRADNIICELKKLCVFGSVLDIGCGDNYFDYRLLNECENVDSVFGIDICRKEQDIDNSNIHVYSNYKKIEKMKFDFILLLDVIEHNENDTLFFESILKYAKKNTVIIITVPAFQHLFSVHDKELKHFRRYNRKLIHKLLKNNAISQLTILEESYFYASLYPLRLLTKFFKNQNIGNWKHDENSVITRFIRFVLNVDYACLRWLSKKKIYLGGLLLLTIVRID